MDNVLIEITPDHPNYKTEEYRLQKYGQCPECDKVNTSKAWCRTCNATRFQQAFSKWSSGNKEIDYFIQNTQIHAWKWEFALEWYSWETFSEIERIGQGGYGTVFRAKRKVGRIRKWDHQNNRWSRYFINEYVALKTIGHSQSLEKDFLNEVKDTFIIDLISKSCFIGYSHF